MNRVESAGNELRATQFGVGQRNAWIDFAGFGRWRRYWSQELPTERNTMTVIGGEQCMQNRGASARRTNNKERLNDLFVSYPGVASNPVTYLKPNFKQLLKIN